MRLLKILLSTMIVVLSFFAPLQAEEPYPLPGLTQTSAQEWLNSKPLTD